MQITQDVGRRRPALLQRRRSETGNRLSARVLQRRQVAYYENLRAPRQTQISRDWDTSGPVDLYALGLRGESFAEWRGGNARSPQGHARGNPFVADLDPARLDRCNHAVGAHLDA